MANRALSSLTAIKLILANHSARIRTRILKGAKAWRATRPENRFTFFFLLRPASSSRDMARGSTWLMDSSPTSRASHRVLSWSLPNKSSKIASWPPSSTF
jgi:hypothetical protein